MKYWFLTLFIATANLVSAHPFHVSVCDMVYESNDKHLKISVRLFLDDLEEVLQTYGDLPNLDIVQEAEQPNIQKLVGESMLENLGGKVGKKEIELNYLGCETDMDVMWIYLEVEKLKPFKNITVRHTSFLEKFDDQENLMNVKKDGEMKGVRLRKGKVESTLSWD